MARRLRHLREAAGLSQAELAERGGVSRQLVGTIESGRSVPAVDAALRLAAALGTTVEAVFGEPAPALHGLVGGAGLRDGARLHVGRVGERLVGWPVERAGTGWWWPSVDGVLAGGRIELLPGIRPDGLVVAGCDPALGIAESLTAALGPRRLVAFSVSSGQALEALTADFCHGALVHGPADRLPTPPVPVRRLHVARWRVGIGAAPRLASLAPDELVAQGVPIAQRDPGAATQQAFLRALGAGVVDGAPPGPRASGHFDAARRAAAGAAACVTFEPAATALELAFTPLETHVVELWLAERHLDHPGVAPLGELLVAQRFAQQVSLLGGYDLGGCGTAVTAPAGATA